MGGWSKCPAVRTRERGPPSASAETISSDYQAFLQQVQSENKRPNLLKLLLLCNIPPDICFAILFRSAFYNCVTFTIFDKVELAAQTLEIFCRKHYIFITGLLTRNKGAHHQNGWTTDHKSQYVRKKCHSMEHLKEYKTVHLACKVFFLSSINIGKIN
jgi:hypothetical protein